MPVWLQIVGAIASALLSYYTRYDDTHVKDMLKDIADNLNLALQRLNEISVQINNLLAEIRKLPDIFARITYANDLEALNVQIKSALVRYDQLINAGHPNNFIIEQTKDIYNRLVAARTALEASSAECPEEFVGLAAVMSPLSYLLEMALLYRIGMDAAGLRDATTASYSAWFKALLDPARPNSLASAVRDGQAALLASDNDVHTGLFGPAAASPGTSQAVYCVEHRIGSDIWNGPFLPRGQTLAEIFQLTWIRLYGLITLQ
jgi:hypothetical protein